MDFPTRYDAPASERRWQERWVASGLYTFRPDDPRPIFPIDTPPPTVSGQLHMGHVYSYTQAEAMARFWRMRGRNVYYPFGFDDNGLPTERFVERTIGRSARDLGRADFIAACLEISRATEDQFEALWRSLGFSVDWSLRYSTIDDRSRRIAQWSFIDLHRKGRIYRTLAPNPWCPECQTAVAQAEMDDAERDATFYILDFGLPVLDCAQSNEEATPKIQNPKSTIQIATTRPELLPACVAVFVHPDDARFQHLVGQETQLPLFGRSVPILADAHVDPAKGSGAVMCCTFGDQTDVLWWREHKLPLIPLLRRDGRLGDAGGPYAGLNLKQARARMLADLEAAGALGERRPSRQSVRVHERCQTPLEIIESSQWFVRLLDEKQKLLELGQRIAWHPAHMRARYEHWVQNLGWDWAISRQRYFGIPFPAWHCAQCGATLLADESQLPIDPANALPPGPCPQCGSNDLAPDEDVMDTWMTSSLSPQIAGQLFEAPELYARLFPMALRPQAHDIIRTWAFYTIVKSYYHFGTLPWQSVMISGHVLTATGEKQSKSKLNAASDPTSVIPRFGADAVRYWACDGALGGDLVLSEERMRDGQRLIAKLWSAARFAHGVLRTDERRTTNDQRRMTNDGSTTLSSESAGTNESAAQPFSILNSQFSIPTDRALLSKLAALIEAATALYERYDYAGAKALAERFFWADLCDSYLELAKGRLYGPDGQQRAAAQHALATALLAVLKLLAPILPHITEELHARLFGEDGGSIHTADWPAPRPEWRDEAAEHAWDATLATTVAARRFKTARKQGMGTPLAHLSLTTSDEGLAALLRASADDIISATRAGALRVEHGAGGNGEEIAPGLWAQIEG